MALFDLEQTYGTQGEVTEEEWQRPTFKDCVAVDINLAFFNLDEHAETHNVDGEDVPVIVEESTLREHSAHWEAGAKQNFDTGLYTSHTILYIKASDYGPRPKVGKQLVLDAGTDHKRTFTILQCKEEDGVYRMTMNRVRQ